MLAQVDKIRSNKYKIFSLTILLWLYVSGNELVACFGMYEINSTAFVRHDIVMVAEHIPYLVNVPSPPNDQITS